MVEIQMDDASIGAAQLVLDISEGSLENPLPWDTIPAARFASTRGTFYRLSVKGFSSDREASALCSQLKRSGATCFVRATFNDVPVQLASR